MNVLVSDRINSFILYNISKYQPIRFLRSHHSAEIVPKGLHLTSLTNRLRVSKERRAGSIKDL